MVRRALPVVVLTALVLVAGTRMAAAQASVTVASAASYPIGTPITWTAVPSGGTAPHSYQVWVYDGTWHLVQDWAPHAQVTFTPTVTHPNATLEVRVRSAGGSGYEGTAVRIVALTPAAAPGSVTPLTPGGTVTTTDTPSWTWTAIPGAASYELSVTDASQTVRLLTYTSVAAGCGAGVGTCAVAPGITLATGAGTWRVRAVNGTGAGSWSSLLAFTIQSLVSVTTLASYQAGVPITWTATAAGGTAPYTYQFWVWHGTWTLAQDWAPSASVTWTPPAAYATAALEVRVRNAGSSSSFDGTAVRAFAITAPAPSSVQLTSAGAGTQMVGTPVTWSVTSAGGVAPHAYQWWVYDGSWTLLSDWTVASTSTWTPTVAHPTATLEVRMRSAGGGTWEATTTRGFAIEALVPVSLGLTGGGGPYAVGLPVTWTVQSAGGGPTAHEYQWWIYDGTWHLRQDWSTAATSHTWTPTVTHPSATLDVRVRRVGSGASYEALAVRTFPITHNLPPVIAAPGDLSGTVGVATSASIVATDPESQPLTYAASGLPPGLALNPATGVISGTPSAAGTFAVSLQVSDGPSMAAHTITWSIAVAPAPPDPPPPPPPPPLPPAPGCTAVQVSPGGVQPTSAGGTYALAVTAVTPAGCAWTASSLVGWAQVDPTAGVGPGAVTVTVAVNYGAAPRAGYVSLADQWVYLDQAYVNNGEQDWQDPTPGQDSGSGGSGGGSGGSGGGGTGGPGGGPSCTFAFGLGEGSALRIETQAGCEWSFSETSGGVTASQLAGAGTADITLSVADPVAWENAVEEVGWWVPAEFEAPCVWGIGDDRIYCGNLFEEVEARLLPAYILEKFRRLMANSSSQPATNTPPVEVRISKANVETDVLEVELIDRRIENVFAAPLRIELLGGTTPKVIHSGLAARGTHTFSLSQKLGNAPAGDFRLRATWHRVPSSPFAVHVPCTPKLKATHTGPLYHSYGFSADSRWSGFSGTFVDAAEEWNRLVWDYTAQTAFVRSHSPNVPTTRFELVDDLRATEGNWARETNSDFNPVYLIEPTIFNYEAAFAKHVALHELGHARAYGDVNDSSCSADTIMWRYADPGGAYLSTLGQGDRSATRRDVGGQ